MVNRDSDALEPRLPAGGQFLQEPARCPGEVPRAAAVLRSPPIVVSDDAGNLAMRRASVSSGKRPKFDEVSGADDGFAADTRDLLERVLESLKVPVHVRDDGEAVSHERLP